jgi:2-keto-4-pentenoate hydratase
LASPLARPRSLFEADAHVAGAQCIVGILTPLTHPTIDTSRAEAACAGNLEFATWGHQMPLDAQVVDALRAQHARRHELLLGGADHVGWKVSYDIAELEPYLGRAPAVGYLTSATLLNDADGFSAEGAGELHAELELMIELGGPGRDISEGMPSLPAIRGVGAAIELVDTERSTASAKEVLASNLFHRAVLLGTTCPIPASEAKAHLVVNGRTRGTARVPVDLAEAVRSIAEQLRAVAESLKPGDRIITGALTRAPVQAGDAITAEIQGLGTLTLEITP